MTTSRRVQWRSSLDSQQLGGQCQCCTVPQSCASQMCRSSTLHSLRHPLLLTHNPQLQSRELLVLYQRAVLDDLKSPAPHSCPALSSGQWLGTKSLPKAHCNLVFFGPRQVVGAAFAVRRSQPNLCGRCHASVHWTGGTGRQFTCHRYINAATDASYAFDSARGGCWRLDPPAP